MLCLSLPMPFQVVAKEVSFRAYVFTAIAVLKNVKKTSRNLRSVFYFTYLSAVFVLIRALSDGVVVLIR